MNARSSIILAFNFVFSATSAHVLAQNLKITIPLHSQLTPVQRLNREGVEAILKQRYEKAEGLFYKAYLYDPADPFTLNNLGYVSELQGQVDRAEQFYSLATKQGCYATIDRSSSKDLRGKPMMDALGTLKNLPMRVNRMNVLGMGLLLQNRSFDAVTLFKEALALAPGNPFVLNNLAVADEAIGDLEGALKLYDQAAASRSVEPVVVTLNRSLRGKPVSELASDSADALRKRMQKMTVNEIRAAMLATHGVYAINGNDWVAARKDFVEAYALAPDSAFALNNRGYVSERDGDLETAKSYYARARNAEDSDARVGSATQSSAQGQHLAAIAEESHRDVDAQLIAYREKRRGQSSTVELKRRNDPDGKSEKAPISVPRGTPLPNLPPQPPQ